MSTTEPRRDTARGEHAGEAAGRVSSSPNVHSRARTVRGQRDQRELVGAARVREDVADVVGHGS